MIIKKLNRVHQPNVLNLNIETKSTFLTFGKFGLKALEGKRLELWQYEAIKLFLKRNIKKRFGRVFYRVFPEQFVTKKSKGNIRMGKGKGNIDRLVTYVKRGQIILEIILKKNLRSYRGLRYLLNQCRMKLPLNIKIVSLKK